MADQGPSTTEAQYTQARDAAACIGEQSVLLDRAWSSGAGLSTAAPAKGHAVPVDDLTNFDRLLTAPGYRVLRSRPKVPERTWRAGEPSRSTGPAHTV
ncbi:hypothetical protein ACWDG9_16430 [Streptomyces sp. NPDC001073]